MCVGPNICCFCDTFQLFQATFELIAKYGFEFNSRRRSRYYDAVDLPPDKRQGTCNYSFLSIIYNQYF